MNRAGQVVERHHHHQSQHSDELGGHFHNNNNSSFQSIVATYVSRIKFQLPNEIRQNQVTSKLGGRPPKREMPFVRASQRQSTSTTPFWRTRGSINRVVVSRATSRNTRQSFFLYLSISSQHPILLIAFSIFCNNNNNNSSKTAKKLGKNSNRSN